MLFWRKKPDPGENQRRHARLNSRNLIKITRQDGSQFEKLSNTFDISEGGLRIVSYEDFPIGTPLKIELLLSDGESLILGANIVWIHPFKNTQGSWFAGVQFADMKDDVRARLRAFISSCNGPQDKK